MKYIIRFSKGIWGVYDNPKGTLTEPFKQVTATYVKYIDYQDIEWYGLKEDVIAWRRYEP